MEPILFQEEVGKWAIKCFGKKVALDPHERIRRFVEESLELAQSCGLTATEAHQLVDYVFARPVGDRAQELGGVMVTLSALCCARGLDFGEAGVAELMRVDQNIDKIRLRHAAKPDHLTLK